MIRINDRISLDESELSFEFIKASGPGGQNVNKVASAVRLRFNVGASGSLPQAVKSRLCKIAGSRYLEAGEIIIEARTHRTQAANREAAIGRLVNLIRKSTEVRKKRYATKPTKASQKRRVEGKKKHADKKRLRGKVRHADE